MNYGCDPNGDSVPIAVDFQGRIILSPCCCEPNKDIAPVEVEAQADTVQPSWHIRFLDWLKSKLE